MMIAVDTDGQGTLDELGELLRTAGVATVGEVIQRRTPWLASIGGTGGAHWNICGLPASRGLFPPPLSMP